MPVRTLFLVFSLSVILKVQAAPQDDVRIDSLLQLHTQISKTDLDSSLLLAKLALSISDSINSGKGLIKSHLAIGMHFLQHRTNSDSARYYLDSGLEVAKEMADSAHMPQYLSGLAKVAYFQDRLQDAMNLYNEAEKLLQDPENNEFRFVVAVGISGVRIKLARSREALPDLLYYLSQNPPALHKKNICNNLGIIYARNKAYDSASYYYNIALSLCDSLESPIGCKIPMLNNLASLDWREQRYTDALDKFKKQLALSREHDNIYHVTAALSNMGLVYLKTEKYDLALKHFNQALSQFEEKGYKNEQRSLLLHMSRTYEAMKDYKSANHYYDKYEALKEELFDINRTAGIQTQIAEEEGKLRELELKILKNKTQRTQAEISSQKTLNQLIILWGLLFLVAMALVGFLWRERYKKQKRTRATQLRKEEEKLVAIQVKQQLKSQHAQLSGKQKTQKLLLDQLGSKVLTPLQNLISNHKKEQNQSQVRVLEAIKQMHDSARSVSHQFHLQANSSQLSLPSSLVDYIQRTARYYKLKPIIDCFPNDPWPGIDQDLEHDLLSILRELIHNVVFHSKSTSIEIHLSFSENEVSFMIEDNGKGFDTKKTPYAVGLSYVQAIVNKWEGSLHIDSNTQRGTIITAVFFNH